MTGRALLYGATGYTGRLVARRLAAAGVDLVLAGRDASRVRDVAGPLGVAWTDFALTGPSQVEHALEGVDVVLHAAGPFAETAAPMLAACLATGTHYLDLSGEWPSFVDAMAADAAAQAASVMVMPGVGLTIAATDCLLALAKEAQPGAVTLRLGVSRPEVITRGTVLSAARLFSGGVVVRRRGKLARVPAGSLAQAFDFGNGLRECTALSWADVVTGGFTTGVDDITVYSELDWPQRASYRATAMATAVTGVRPWRQLGEVLSERWPEGPTDEDRRRAGFVMVAEAADPWRRVRRVRIRTLDGYTVSELTAVEAVKLVLAGTWRAGFQTPARVFGSDFILRLGCAELLDSRPAQTGAGAAS